MSLEAFLKPLDSSYIQHNLLTIADVEQYFKKVSKGEINQQRNFLYIASALIVVAVTLFYIGFSKQLFNERIYQYQSKGAVLAGEPLNIFTHWRDLIDSSDPVKHGKEMREQRVVMAQRSDVEIKFTYENKGDFFDISNEEGVRFFERKGSGQSPRAINVWLQIVGVLFFSSGVMGFVLERKFYKK
jgi:hypothetical protein